MTTTLKIYFLHVEIIIVTLLDCAVIIFFHFFLVNSTVCNKFCCSVWSLVKILIYSDVILIPRSAAWFVTSTVLTNSFISLYPSFKCHSVKGKFSHTLSKFKMSKMKWDSLLTKSTSWVLVAVYLYFSIFHRDQKFS